VVVIVVVVVVVTARVVVATVAARVVVVVVDADTCIAGTLRNLHTANQPDRKLYLVHHNTNILESNIQGKTVMEEMVMNAAMVAAMAAVAEAMTGAAAMEKYSVQPNECLGRFCLFCLRFYNDTQEYSSM